MIFNNFVSKRRGVKLSLEEELDNLMKIENAKASKH
jgi:hypothetical protein